MQDKRSLTLRDFEVDCRYAWEPMRDANRSTFAAAIAPAFILLAALIAIPFPANAQNYQVDEYGSHRITHYLHDHGLPLVGAQIVDNSDGSRELHLFGFVATPYGMQDAQQKALKYLGDNTIQVVNSIQVNPSIESMRPLPSNAPAAGYTPLPQPAGGVPGQWAYPQPAAGVPGQWANPLPAAGTPGQWGNPQPSAAAPSQWDKTMDNILRNGAQPLPQPSGPLLP